MISLMFGKRDTSLSQESHLKWAYQMARSLNSKVGEFRNVPLGGLTFSIGAQEGLKVFERHGFRKKIALPHLNAEIFQKKKLFPASLRL